MTYNQKHMTLVGNSIPASTALVWMNDVSWLNLYRDTSEGPSKTDWRWSQLTSQRAYYHLCLYALEPKEKRWRITWFWGIVVMKIFRIMGEHLERMELLAISRMLAWESETIRKSPRGRKFMRVRASRIAQHSAVNGDTKANKLEDNCMYM